jgi:hypothetical protein
MPFSPRGAGRPKKQVDLGTEVFGRPHAPLVPVEEGVRRSVLPKVLLVWPVQPLRDAVEACGWPKQQPDLNAALSEAQDRGLLDLSLLAAKYGQDTVGKAVILPPKIGRAHV